MLIAPASQNQFGIGVVSSNPVLAVKFQSYHDNIMNVKAVKRNPTNVTKFGATHLGKNCSIKCTKETEKEEIEKQKHTQKRMST